MAKKSRASSSMESLVQEELEMVICGEEENLSYWEFINTSDADSHSHDEDDGFSSWDSVLSDPISLKSDPIEDHHHHDLRDLHDHHEVDVMDVIVHDHHDAHDHNQERYDGYYDKHEEEEEDDDEDEDEDEDGLDDELVPWHVADKFGRQRMRKLGKRECAKMRGSKRSPYLYVRPGCVHGKHGLGLKHNY